MVISVVKISVSLLSIAVDAASFYRVMNYLLACQICILDIIDMNVLWQSSVRKVDIKTGKVTESLPCVVY